MLLLDPKQFKLGFVKVDSKSLPSPSFLLFLFHALKNFHYNPQRPGAGRAARRSRAPSQQTEAKLASTPPSALPPMGRELSHKEQLPPAFFFCTCCGLFLPELQKPNSCLRISPAATLTKAKYRYISVSLPLSPSSSPSPSVSFFLPLPRDLSSLFEMGQLIQSHQSTMVLVLK